MKHRLEFASDRSLSRRVLIGGTAALALGSRSHAGAQTPVASSDVGDFAPFVERINELMMLMPIPAGEESEKVPALTFADIERQLASVGMAKPVGEEVPEGYLEVTAGLPLTSSAFVFALSAEWWETFGFEPLQVGRTLEAVDPGNTVRVFAGGIDPERVRAALLAAGYQEIDQETGGSYLTFGEDFSPDTVVGRLGVGSMNQAVIRDDTVIFTYREATIQLVTQVIAGYAPSMLEQGGWPDLMTTFSPDVVGAMGVHPAVLADLGDVSMVHQLAFGVREGADNRDFPAGSGAPVATAVAEMPANRARVEVRIRYADAATAQREAEAIPQRWSSMSSSKANRPLTDLMLVKDAYVSDRDPTVAAIDFRVQGSAKGWRSILDDRDLAPFVPASQ